MNTTFKITRRLFESIKVNLSRPHSFAYERVGWIRCRVGTASNRNLIVLAHDYFPVADADYLAGHGAGATINSDAIRKALQLALDKRISIFHVHLHDHDGPTRFSGTDRTETEKMIPDFWNVRPDMSHGAVVFSQTSIYGRCWYAPGEIFDFRKIIIVGAPIILSDL